MFGNKKSSVYLDWASAAPVSVNAGRVFIQALNSGVFGNPSSPHAEGERAHLLLEQARKTIARLAGVKSDGVIFTSGATESNNLAIKGTFLSAGKGAHMLYLPTAHSSVVETMKVLGVDVEELVLKNGAVDLDALKKQLRPETVLVSMDVVCGETGTKYATRDVRRVLDAYVAGTSMANRSNRLHMQRILLHVDASQAPFVESIDCNHLGADLLTLDAQKVGGVRGIGALIRTNALIPLIPIMQGGGQEQGIRPGTESPLLAAAFAEALVEADKGREEFKARAAGARSELLETLTTSFPDMTINVGKEFTPHILNMSFPHRDTDYAVMLLSKAGYAVSTKSACETDETGSRVVLTLLKSMENLEDKTWDEAQLSALSTLRISWGPSTSTKDLRSFSKELIRVVQFLDSNRL